MSWYLLPQLFVIVYDLLLFLTSIGLHWLSVSFCGYENKMLSAFFLLTVSDMRSFPI